MSTPETSISGVILAGGMGRRMGGQDKGLLLFEGRPLIEYLLDALSPQVSHILINANRNPSLYARYGHPVLGDPLPDFQGPLAGFSAAMQAAQTTHIMTLPCDGPWIAPDMARRLLDALRNQPEAALAVAHDGERLQPVHALIPVSLHQSLQAFLARGERKIDRWYQQHPMVHADFSDVARLFRNINTPEQQQALQQQYRREQTQP
ncbi:MAG: molybdenum cofactor guanylyltransferase [Thiothrix sp.]|nr:molybdenum cofactor guanylyltransferase [Thiothrix sp.]HPQ96630.1 molybdenum cofactor guanylyltransferase MobA [Thiolinea sp.]